MSEFLARDDLDHLLSNWSLSALDDRWRSIFLPTIHQEAPRYIHNPFILAMAQGSHRINPIHIIILLIIFSISVFRAEHAGVKVLYHIHVVLLAVGHYFIDSINTMYTDFYNAIAFWNTKEFKSFFAIHIDLHNNWSNYYIFLPFQINTFLWITGFKFSSFFDDYADDFKSWRSIFFDIFIIFVIIHISRIFSSVRWDFIVDFNISFFTKDDNI